MDAYIKILCFFRKRVVLSLIFLFSLAYFLLQFNAFQLIRFVSFFVCVSQLSLISLFCLFQHRRFQDDGEFEEIVYKRDSPLIWRSLKEYNLSAESTCRNSEQGVKLIADERGFICTREDLLATGCCNIKADNTHLYHCDTCDDSHCCEVFENCVSCCLNPDNVSRQIKVFAPCMTSAFLSRGIFSQVQLLEKIIAQASDRQKLLFSQLTDQFELCLSICRR